jgi:hypothetical protein
MLFSALSISKISMASHAQQACFFYAFLPLAAFAAFFLPENPHFYKLTLTPYQ